MDLTLLEEGASLMMVGMGTVFFFLTVLVFATAAMSKLVSMLQPTASGEPETISREEVAVITTAIKRHRARQPAE